MHATITIAAVTLTTLAFAAAPASAAEAPRVTGSAGCAEAGKFHNFLVKVLVGPGAIGEFISNDARTNGPLAVAQGTNAFKAAFCA